METIFESNNSGEHVLQKEILYLEAAEGTGALGDFDAVEAQLTILKDTISTSLPTSVDEPTQLTRSSDSPI